MFRHFRHSKQNFFVIFLLRLDYEFFYVFLWKGGSHSYMPVKCTHNMYIRYNHLSLKSLKILLLKTAEIYFLLVYCCTIVLRRCQQNFKIWQRSTWFRQHKLLVYTTFANTVNFGIGSSLYNEGVIYGFGSNLNFLF